MKEDRFLTGFLTVSVVAVAAVSSGCTEVPTEQQRDQLLGEVDQNRVTTDSPGRIVLNARNLGNETREFTVSVMPAGDYDRVVEVTDREGRETKTVDLGEAVPDATTGEKFVYVRKRLNITSRPEIRAELYVEGAESPIDSRTFSLRTSRG